MRRPRTPGPLPFCALACALAAACGPTPRNLGDPSGLSREQDVSSEAPLALAVSMPAAGPGAFSVLAANVGNIDVFRCDAAVYKLCARAQEDAIAARVRQLRPDVALLAELMNPSQCEALAASVPDWHVCHPAQALDEPDQARRVLGPDYTIACEKRRGYECIGVRKDFAALQECPRGALCRGALRSLLPLPGCDDGFTISAATAVIDGEPVDLLVGHPPSGWTSDSVACRRQYLPWALEPRGEGPSLRAAPKALFGGDLNLDPFRQPQDDDAAYFLSRVRLDFGAEGGPFALHSGPVEHDPPYWSAPLLRRTLDHVVSEGLVGRCETLGAAPLRPALDLAQGTELQRLDHLAQYCVLSLAP